MLGPTDPAQSESLLCHNLPVSGPQVTLPAITRQPMSQPLRPATYAWLVVALLVPVALLNYLDRQMLATMKASMVGDIPSIANKADWGFVLGCFKWTYAFLSPFGGFIADRFSKRYVIAGSLFVWSAVT